MVQVEGPKAPKILHSSLCDVIKLTNSILTVESMLDNESFGKFVIYGKLFCLLKLKEKGALRFFADG